MARLQSPDLGIVRRKYRVAREDGPLAFLADVLVKKLNHHSFPVTMQVYDLGGPLECAFIMPPRGRDQFSPDFERHLLMVLRVVLSDNQADAHIEWDMRGFCLYLDGPHYMNGRGQIRKGNCDGENHAKRSAGGGSDIALCSGSDRLVSRI